MSSQNIESFRNINSVNIGVKTEFNASSRNGAASPEMGVEGASGNSPRSNLNQLSIAVSEKSEHSEKSAK